MQYNNIHRDFILTPSLSVIEDAVNACSGVGSGMGTYPLKDYLFQSLFLQLTGFQEQKLKCICWTLATYDFDYRRILLKDDDHLGEFSSINSKTRIYVRILEVIERYRHEEIELNKILDKTAIRQGVEDSVKDIFQNTLFEIWAPEEFASFIHNGGLFQEKYFCTDKNTLLQSPLRDTYISLYNHRNRCAHNTLSYQDNLPAFNTLKANDSYGNYFVWYTLLLLLDQIFIDLFKEYEVNRKY